MVTRAAVAAPPRAHVAGTSRQRRSKAVAALAIATYLVLALAHTAAAAATPGPGQGHAEPAAAPTVTVVNVDVTRSLGTLDPRYVSFTFDQQHFVNGLAGFDFSDPALATLARGFGPSLWRIGGTEADWIRYDVPGAPNAPDGTAPRRQLLGAPQDATMSAANFSTLCSFASSVGWQILFGLNNRVGFNATAAHAWNSTNAERLVRYARAVDCPVVGWELGNEDDLTSYGKDFTPQIEAQHFSTLNTMLRGVYGGDLGAGTVASPWVVGPDCTHNAVAPDGHRPLFLTQFLQNLTTPAADSSNSRSAPFPPSWLRGTGGVDRGRGAASGDAATATAADVSSAGSPAGIVDRVTWHHYFPCKPTSTYQQFLQPALLDTLIPALRAAQDAVTAYRTSPSGGTRVESSQLFLGETSVDLNCKFDHPAHHITGLDGRYAGMVPFVDKLGLAAQHGHSAVMRQALDHVLVQPSGGGGTTPVPAFWGMLLMKRLWGATALPVVGMGQPGDTLRAYAACGAAKGTVSVVLLNLRNDSVAVELQLGGTTPTGSSAGVYALAPFPNASNVTAAGVALNGAQVQYSGGAALPPLDPQVVPVPASGTPLLTIGAKGVAFVSVPVGACGGQASQQVVTR